MNGKTLKQKPKDLYDILLQCHHKFVKKGNVIIRKRDQEKLIQKEHNKQAKKLCIKIQYGQGKVIDNSSNFVIYSILYTVFKGMIKGCPLMILPSSI